MFLMFDNDLHNKTDFDNRRSRILEVTINENTMTAWASWVWTAPREKFSGYWGDADRLPNGNRLGVFGTQHHDLEGSSGAYLVEITPEGEIVREYDFQRGYGMYRCEIIDPTDLLRPQYFEEYYARYTQDHVTLIYPSASPEKARGCEPASYSDWNAASILYTGLDDVNEVLDTNAFIVNQTTGATLLESGSSLITIGGPIVNPVVGYYESDDSPAYDRAPLKCAINEERIEYQKRDGTPIAGLSLDEANMNTDYFLIEIFMDGRGRTAYICYGLGWKGTLASGKYFVREFETLMESESSWTVVQWTDTNMNDFVNGPRDGDTYTVIASG